MKKLLQTTFWEPVPAETLLAIKDLGFDGIRIDLGQLNDQTKIRELIDPVLEAGLWPLIIFSNTKQLVYIPDGLNVELLNEPDLSGPGPRTYLQLLDQVSSIAVRRSQQLWAGVISNLNQRGFTYLEALQPANWPAYVNVSIHHYPVKPWDPRQPHNGYQSRYHEYLKLKSIIGNRPYGVSEFGYHTAPERLYKWLPKKWSCNKRSITDEQALDNLRYEWAYWTIHGAQFACLYQLNDGPTNTTLDRYGIRDIYGGWKPQSKSVL